MAHAVVCTVGPIPYMSPHKVQVPAKITNKNKSEQFGVRTKFVHPIAKENKKKHELL